MAIRTRECRVLIGRKKVLIKANIESRTKYTMWTRPAKNFCVVMLQTPLKFLGQNLFGDPFWGWSEAGKVRPQAILGPGAKGLTGGTFWIVCK